jgi:hypothetical protein
MKNKLKLYSAIVALALMFSSCIKQDEPLFTESVVEFDLATWTAKSGGNPFPIVTRTPSSFGRALLTTNNPATGLPWDPVVTRTNVAPNDTVRMRINVVGPQSSSPQVINVRVASNFSTATPGVHFDLLDTQVTIPANSSFGVARWVVRNPGPPAVAGTSVLAVFELVGNDTFKPSENFKYLGWLIAQ